MKIAFVLILVALLSGCGEGYSVQADKVVFSSMTENGRITVVVAGAHADSFVQLANAEYGKDRLRVYWRGSEIAGADPDSFKCLEHLYSRDRSRVFWRERVIPGANPASFVILNGRELWSRDSRDVFLGDQSVGAIKPDSFRVLNDSWASDGVAYYYVRQFVPVGVLRSDYQSTRLLNGAYAVDRDRAYFRTRPIPEADPATFRPLSEWYAVDAKRAFFEAAPIVGADVATFELGSHYHTAKDREHTYVFGKAK